MSCDICLAPGDVEGGGNGSGADGSATPCPDRAPGDAVPACGPVAEWPLNDDLLLSNINIEVILRRGPNSLVLVVVGRRVMGV
jgi:hypothetical protein